jgi:hypothetical protein
MNPVFPVILAKTEEVPGLANQLFRETEFDANPYELLPVGKVALWTLSAAVHGRPRLLLDLLAQGKRAGAVQAELKGRKALLDAAGES